MKTTTSKVEEISAVLRHEILRGQYRPGERLPSERDLATRFEANRGAVRESLKKLEQMGIADITPGGVRVVPVEEATLDVLGHIMDLQELPDPALVDHVLEVLGALMSMSARTAIEAASDEEVTALRALLKDMIEHVGDSERNQESWKELGSMFARINNNLVLRLILNGLKTQFVSRMSTHGPKISLERDKHLDILIRINDGVVERDAEGVAAAIRDHFRLLQVTVNEALKTTQTISNSARSISNG